MMSNITVVDGENRPMAENLDQESQLRRMMSLEFLGWASLYVAALLVVGGETVLAWHAGAHGWVTGSLAGSVVALVFVGLAALRDWRRGGS